MKKMADDDLSRSSNEFFGKLRGDDKNWLKQLNFLFDLEKDEVHVTSDAKDSHGKSLLSFDITPDGTITSGVYRGSDQAASAPKTQTEIEAAQEQLAWNIIYFFVSFLFASVAGLYVYFKMQQKQVARSDKQNFLEFLADKLEDPSFVKKENEERTEFEL
jgi:hypothetical protein